MKLRRIATPGTLPPAILYDPCVAKKKVNRKKKPTLPDAPELSFEDALEQLEALIDRVESGEVGLEESIAQYERGAALVKRCRAVLDKAEKRITELTAEDLDGPAPEDYDAPASRDDE